jgi:uncharacterized phage infection (PIP) family protein YhgE
VIKLADKPKTVFERLEDRMIEIDESIAKIPSLILDKIIPAIDKIKNDLPSSIGPNLMNFADMIGEQIENLSNQVSNMGGTAGGATGDTNGINASINQIQNNFNQLLNGINQLNAKIDGMNKEIVNLKALTGETKTTIKTKPETQTTIKQPVQKTVSQPQKPIQTPSKTVIKSQPAPAIETKPQMPTITTESSTVPPQVFELFDKIGTKLKAGTPAEQMAQIMEDVRDEIVNIFKWTPVLYEVATQARKLRKAGNVAIDPDMYQLLLEKVPEWKNRIKSG